MKILLSKIRDFPLLNLYNLLTELSLHIYEQIFNNLTQHGIIYSFYCDQCYGCYLLKSPKERLNLESLQFHAGDMEKDQGSHCCFYLYIQDNTPKRTDASDFSAKIHSSVFLLFVL